MAPDEGFFMSKNKTIPHIETPKTDCPHCIKLIKAPLKYPRCRLCHEEHHPKLLPCPSTFLKEARLYANWVEADKDWMFNTYRQVFKRKSDGAEVDKEFAYKNINLDADSVGDELDKLFEKGII